MKERKEILSNIFLKEIQKWICEEKNISESKLKLYQLMMAEKLLLSHSNWDEVLKCVKNEYVKFDGFIPYSQKTHTFYESNTELITRAYAELDSNHKQLITNAYLHTVNEGVHMYGFLDKTGKKKMVEKSSLTGSIGMIGGHVNSNDHSFYAGLVREISEEFKSFHLEEVKHIYPIGYINDSSSQISTYHVCILYEIQIPYSIIGNIIPNTDEGKIIWFTEDQIKKELDKGVLDSRLDSWAYIAMSNAIKQSTR